MTMTALAHGLRYDRAERIIGGFPGRRLLVLGDLMLDEYIWGKARRISPEAPVPVVEVERESLRLGGAGNVASNLVNLNAEAVVVGVVGEDATAERLIEELQSLRISTAGLVRDASRPTTLKTRIIAHHQQIVRADRESRAPVSEEIAHQVIRRFRDHLDSVDGVIISDYEKGTVTPLILGAILPEAERLGVPVFLDPKIRNFPFYSPVTFLKPNQREAEHITGIELVDEEAVITSGRRMMERVRCDYLLLTRGEKGMTLFSHDGNVHHIPTVAREVFDVTGAGDTVMAVLGVSFVSGASALEAAVLANYAASVVIAKIGTATVTPAELQQALAADLLPLSSSPLAGE